MITVNLTEPQAKLVEDALAMMAVSYPGNNEVCVDVYSIFLNARHGFKVNKMIAENSEVGSNWLQGEIA